MALELDKWGVSLDHIAQDPELGGEQLLITKVCGLPATRAQSFLLLKRGPTQTLAHFFQTNERMTPNLGAHANMYIILPQHLPWNW